MKKVILLFLTISAILSPENLLAHGSHGTGFMAGFTHPIFGMDHLLAVFGIGVFGFSILKEKQWIPSFTFIIAMLIGGILGMETEAFSITEPIIMLSVIIVGILIAYEVSLSSLLTGLLFAFIGFFHGHAHGTEMPKDSNVPLFVLGFIVAAILIAALGWGITKLIKQGTQIRLLGAFVAGMGLSILLG